MAAAHKALSVTELNGPVAISRLGNGPEGQRDQIDNGEGRLDSMPVGSRASVSARRRSHRSGELRLPIATSMHSYR
jgi:hypothetical protein